jgi:hypothetical protein
MLYVRSRMVSNYALRGSHQRSPPSKQSFLFFPAQILYHEDAWPLRGWVCLSFPPWNEQERHPSAAGTESQQEKARYGRVLRRQRLFGRLAPGR